MKLLHTFDLLSPSRGGGTVTIVHNVTRALAGNGHEVVVYTSDYQLNQEHLESFREVKIYPFHCLSRIGNFYFTPAMIGEVKRHLQEFDVVHLHCFRSFQNMVIHHYAKKYRIPYILDAHGSLPRTTRSERNLKWLLKWLFDSCYGKRLLRDASRVIAETEDGFNEYQAMGVNRNDISLITPPFDISEFSNLPTHGRFREKYEIKAKYIILFLGRIHWIKGIDFLVKSFGEMSKLRNDTILVIAGPDDGHLTDLQKLINKLKLSEKVLFTGYIGGAEKLAAMVDADVLVQTSIYEQGTGVPFEAVLCGTPIIVSRDTVASRNVKDIDAGYLVEYGNVKELVKVLQSVLDNPAEAEAKTQRAREYIRQNLSLEKGIKKYEKLYEEVAGTA